MADWFVQHGGKQYGPLPAAKLKQLAADGKISPTTSVRLGTDGAWVPASRVKGLFDSAGPAATARVPTPRTIEPPSAPPIAPAPLLATPLVRAQPPKVTPLAKGAPVVGKSVSTLVVGGVSLVLGILALATCWLPALGAGAAWVAIGIAATGLLVGIIAFVMAAMHKGSGLALGIAGTSTSLVAGVLSIVVWIFLSQMPTPTQVIAVAPPVVQPAPPPLAEPAPEPEPEPEPVWTDAREAIEQGPIRARLVSARIEPVTLESLDLSTLKRQKAKPMLKLRVSLENISTDTMVAAPGWPGGADLVGQGVTELLGGDAGKALKSATATAALTDQAGNSYKQVPIVQVFGAKMLASADPSLRPTEKVEHELIFAEPLATIEYLRLELPSAGFNGSDALRFQIGRELIQGLKAAGN